VERLAFASFSKKENNILGGGGRKTIDLFFLK